MSKVDLDALRIERGVIEQVEQDIFIFQKVGVDCNRAVPERRLIHFLACWSGLTDEQTGCGVAGLRRYGAQAQQQASDRKKYNWE